MEQKPNLIIDPPRRTCPHPSIGVEDMLNRGCSEEKQMPAIAPVDSVASPKKFLALFQNPTCQLKIGITVGSGST